MNKHVFLVLFFLTASTCAFSQIGQPVSGRAQPVGLVTAAQSAVPGTTTSTNTLNPSIQAQGAYAGSIPGTAKLPFSGRLSLREAIDRGLSYNLGPASLNNVLLQARGQSKVARSTLLPNLAGNITEAVQQSDLRAAGLRVSTVTAGVTFPTIVGPFNYVDFRARLTQTVLDLTAVNNYRSAEQMVRASEFSVEDARDLTVLAAGGAYLQTIAAAARVEAARAQLDTANALFKQTADRRGAGVVAQIDLNRVQVQALTQQQRLLSLENDLAKQKINLARITGLPPNDQYELTDDVAFSPAPQLSIEEALKQAGEQRSDLKSAEAQVRSAERTAAAARTERLPAVSISADYGVIGVNPSQSHATFSVVGAVRIPIWQGGRTGGNVEQAEAALGQKRAELADLRGRIESEVRSAYLDLQSAGSQIDVAQKNLQVNQETLMLTRQRLEAGVSDNLAVVQSQEGVASAKLDYINSVFAHNAAKLSFARALGHTAESWPRFLQVK